MKAISIAACIAVTMAISMSACATPDMTPDQQKVRPITEPGKCEFLKTAYFEVSHPSKVHYYAAKNVVEAGGDSFSIVVTGGSYAGYDFEADEAAFEAGTSIMQVASGVLSAATDATFEEQFATVRGPAILPASFVKLGNSPWDADHYQNLQDLAIALSIQQLARRGIVLR